jgi:molecular chaperone GrpE
MQSPNDDASPAGHSSLATQLAQALRDRDDMLSLARHLRDEHNAYRQRVERDRSADADRGRLETIESLLPLLDDLDRALARIPRAIAADPWVTGVQLLGLHLQATLGQMGIDRLADRDVPFDPTIHEAVGTVHRTDATTETVIEVTRPGYRLGDRLIRAAQVIVATDRTVEESATEVAPENPDAALEDAGETTAPPPRPGGLFDRRA